MEHEPIRDDPTGEARGGSGEGGGMMGYFPNGTSGGMYQECLCECCQNWRDLGDGRGPGCPIWDLHVLWNYQQNCDKGSDKEAALSHFIPLNKNHENERCVMFLPIPGYETVAARATSKLFEQTGADDERI